MSAPRRVLVTLAAGLVLVACSAGGVAAPASSAPVPVATTSAPPAPAPPAPALTGRTVVLDPGHNGRNGSAAARAEVTRQVPDGRGGTKACNTTGTSTNAGYPEHAFAWDLARRVQTRLEAAGARVVLTRPSDDGVGPCVDVRGRAGQEAGANLMVSLHADGSAAPNHGFHVAYSSPPLNPAQAGPAVTLATDLRDGLVAGGFPVSDYIGRAGLSPRPDLAGLNLATVPAALVECGNMRNADEAAVLSSPEGRDRYAAAIAQGIERFLS
ncbi:N-acetylmuramoyl-L-alanine amidase [Pseudonocardia sp. WMMC193]|uniref:N-acetylmuramoyl-L-alanine amidase n=1 Tax=Pseudonocardia sp. WMMC193 TaxID=2911965 RepID=UPI001F186771|nr:N-acetylmuramoyl-L-alanine amidase [Pseudonocardia sp. WMMC193]MCF7551673.1 N-acetylmuramoyl-L-alanine amidase [Pseudonocardia sp. WMMC193]